MIKPLGSWIWMFRIDSRKGKVAQWKTENRKLHEIVYHFCPRACAPQLSPSLRKQEVAEPSQVLIHWWAGATFITAEVIKCRRLALSVIKLFLTLFISEAESVKKFIYWTFRHRWLWTNVYPSKTFIHRSASPDCRVMPLSPALKSVGAPGEKQLLLI